MQCMSLTRKSKIWSSTNVAATMWKAKSSILLRSNHLWHTSITVEVSLLKYIDKVYLTKKALMDDDSLLTMIPSIAYVQCKKKIEKNHMKTRLQITVLLFPVNYAFAFHLTLTYTKVGHNNLPQYQKKRFLCCTAWSRQPKHGIPLHSQSV